MSLGWLANGNAAQLIIAEPPPAMQIIVKHRKCLSQLGDEHHVTMKLCLRLKSDSSDGHKLCDI